VGTFWGLIQRFLKTAPITMVS